MSSSLGARASRPQILADHFRGYLPHWERGETPQAITFRLADSLPKKLLDAWSQELSALSEEDQAEGRRQRITESLDAGYGACWLAHPEIAREVEMALRHFDNERYHLHGWCIMPNHVHVIITPIQTTSLSSILHGWKSFTGKRINSILGRQGMVWQPEYFDRMIRHQEHFLAALHYVEQNPVAAGLCAKPQDWPFSSARSTPRAGETPALP